MDKRKSVLLSRDELTEFTYALKHKPMMDDTVEETVKVTVESKSNHEIPQPPPLPPTHSFSIEPKNLVEPVKTEQKPRLVLNLKTTNSYGDAPLSPLVSNPPSVTREDMDGNMRTLSIRLDHQRNTSIDRNKSASPTKMSAKRNSILPLASPSNTLELDSIVIVERRPSVNPLSRRDSLAPLKGNKFAFNNMISRMNSTTSFDAPHSPGLSGTFNPERLDSNHLNLTRGMGDVPEMDSLGYPSIHESPSTSDPVTSKNPSGIHASSSGSEYVSTMQDSRLPSGLSTFPERPDLRNKNDSISSLTSYPTIDTELSRFSIAEPPTAFTSPVQVALEVWKEKIDEQAEKLKQWTRESQQRQLARQTQMALDKERTDVLLHTSSDKKAKALMKRLSRIKKQGLASAEFYGVDFGPPVTSPIITPNRLSQTKQDSIQEEKEEEEVVERHGSIFISALNTLALQRNFDSTKEDHPEKSLDVLPIAVKNTHVQLEDKIDYSEVFSDIIGTQEGVTVFRIESLEPAIQRRDTVGRFCVADCYIILVSDTKPSTGPSEDSFEYRIYTWIGQDAEMDKRFCCAMYSVGLRNWLHASCRIEREVENEESQEFLDLFGNDFEYEDLSHGTESGLFVAELKRYPLRLYRVYGQRAVQLHLVDPVYWALQCDSVYILDWGLEIFQWSGSKSNLQHKSKARMLCDRINKLERVGKANFVELEENSEEPRFWEILGGQRTEEDILAFEDVDDPDIAEELYFLFLADQVPKIYQALSELKDIAEHQVHFSKLKRNLLTSEGCYIIDWGVELFLWIGNLASAASKLSATELLARVLASQKRPKWLGLTRCVETHEPETFKIRFVDWDGSPTDPVNWEEIKAGTNGKKSTVTKTKMVVDVKALYAKAPKYDIQPSIIDNTIRHANSRLESFTTFIYSKGRFIQLAEEHRATFFTNDAFVFLCLYHKEKDDLDMVDRLVERDDLDSSIPDIVLHSSQDLAPSLPADQNLENVPNDLDPNESNPMKEDEEVPVEEAKPQVLECIVYFWQGRHASRLPYSTFKLKTLHEMETLVEHMYGCNLRVIHVEQGKEPISLLAHLENRALYHVGTKDTFVKNLTDEMENTNGQYRLYHIHTDVRYHTTRAAQVGCVATSLVPRDCFFLHGFGKSQSRYLWVGKGTSDEDIDNAKSIIEDLLSYIDDQVSEFTPKSENIETAVLIDHHYDIVFENHEPRQFWSCLVGGRQLYASSEQFSRKKPPRFLKCSCAQGFFQVEEILHFSQSDCAPDTCVLMDPGSVFKMYVWIGSEASDVVRKLTKKSVEVWLEYLNDGRIVIFDELIDEETPSLPTHDRTMSDSDAHSRGIVQKSLNASPDREAFERGRMRSDGKSKTRSMPTGGRVIETAGDVVFVLQGREPLEFRAMFHAWDAFNSLDKLDAGSLFSREAKIKRDSKYKKSS